MSRSPQHHLRSWIPPRFTWTDMPDVFALEVEITDPDVVAFVATGFHEVPILGSNEVEVGQMASLLGDHSLTCQLLEAVCTSKFPRSSGSNLGDRETVVAYCHGVFRLPQAHNILVLVGRNPQVGQPEGWLSAVREKAKELYDAHLERIRQDEANESESFERSKVDRHLWDCAKYYFKGTSPPKLIAEALIPFLPKAAIFNAPSASQTGTIVRRATVAIEQSGWLPPRGGDYEGILSIPLSTKKVSLISWEPYDGLPSYPEVRWAVQRRLPSGLRRPRLEQSNRPEFESSVVDIASVGGIDPDTGEFVDGFQEIEFSAGQRTDTETRKELSGQGFEAIAWYQSYHDWSESTWGIYMDAAKLDDFAL